MSGDLPEGWRLESGENRRKQPYAVIYDEAGNLIIDARSVEDAFRLLGERNDLRGSV
jgi:hypothetical protein